MPVVPDFVLFEAMNAPFRFVLAFIENETTAEVDLTPPDAALNDTDGRVAAA